MRRKSFVINYDLHESALLHQYHVFVINCNS